MQLLLTVGTGFILRYCSVLYSGTLCIFQNFLPLKVGKIYRMESSGKLIFEL